MLNIPQEIISKYIFPELSDKNLGRLALCCTQLKKIAGQEIIKRALENIEASYLLMSKIDGFLKRDVQVLGISKKDAQEDPFSFYPFFNLLSIKTVKETFRHAFKLVEGTEKKEMFYAELDCKKELIPHCIHLIDELEYSFGGGPSRYNYININRNFLSTGNIAWFSMVNKEHQLKKEEILLWDNYGSEAHYNKQGHSSILLFADSNGSAPEISSIELFTQLKENVSSLEEVRLLEIDLNSVYSPRMRSCFTDLLAGASKLSFLKCLYCWFHHPITSEHIEDIVAYVNDRLIVNKRSLDQIFIFCHDISPQQITSLASSVNNILKVVAQREIILHVKIRGRTCTHEILNDFYGQSKVDLRISFQI